MQAAVGTAADLARPCLPADTCAPAPTQAELAARAEPGKRPVGEYPHGLRLQDASLLVMPRGSSSASTAVDLSDIAAALAHWSIFIWGGSRTGACGLRALPGVLLLSARLLLPARAAEAGATVTSTSLNWLNTNGSQPAWQLLDSGSGSNPSGILPATRSVMVPGAGGTSLTLFSTGGVIK